MNKIILTITTILLLTIGIFASAEIPSQTHYSDIGNWSEDVNISFVMLEVPTDTTNPNAIIIYTADDLFVSQHSFNRCGNQRRIIIYEGQKGYRDLYDMAIIAKGTGQRIRVWALNSQSTLGCATTPYGEEGYYINAMQFWD